MPSDDLLHYLDDDDLERLTMSLSRNADGPWIVPANDISDPTGEHQYRLACAIADEKRGMVYAPDNGEGSYWIYLMDDPERQVNAGIVIYDASAEHGNA